MPAHAFTIILIMIVVYHTCDFKLFIIFSYHQHIQASPNYGFSSSSLLVLSPSSPSRLPTFLSLLFRPNSQSPPLSLFTSLSPSLYLCLFLFLPRPSTLAPFLHFCLPFSPYLSIFVSLPFHLYLVASPSPQLSFPTSLSHPLSLPTFAFLLSPTPLRSLLTNSPNLPLPTSLSLLPLPTSLSPLPLPTSPSPLILRPTSLSYIPTFLPFYR